MSDLVNIIQESVAAALPAWVPNGVYAWLVDGGAWLAAASPAMLLRLLTRAAR